MELAFLGGATTVTGSQFLLETGDTRAPRRERLPRLDLRDRGDERSRRTGPPGRGQAADRVREARGATRAPSPSFASRRGSRASRVRARGDHRDRRAALHRGGASG